MISVAECCPVGEGTNGKVIKWAPSPLQHPPHSDVELHSTFFFLIILDLLVSFKITTGALV